MTHVLAPTRSRRRSCHPVRRMSSSRSRAGSLPGQQLAAERQPLAEQPRVAHERGEDVGATAGLPRRPGRAARGPGRPARRRACGRDAGLRCGMARQATASGPRHGKDPPMIRLTAMLRRNPALSAGEFHAHWRDVHAAKILVGARHRRAGRALRAAPPRARRCRPLDRQRRLRRRDRPVVPQDLDDFAAMVADPEYRRIVGPDERPCSTWPAASTCSPTSPGDRWLGGVRLRSPAGDRARHRCGRGGAGGRGRATRTPGSWSSATRRWRPATGWSRT